MLTIKKIQSSDLRTAINKLWELSAAKIDALDKSWDPGKGAPVFTVEGRYTSRGWTEWTQGFQLGAGLLQFDATGDKRYYEVSRRQIIDFMAPHITHFGVHDHGFNNVSTYGAMRRLMLEGRIPYEDSEMNFCELALKCSGAVQAHRWTTIPSGGYIYSFNGPHSLFADTIRSLRALALSHTLGHALLGERDLKISLLERLVQHARTTAEFAVYYGKGRDTYDVRGRVAHESVFNINDGNYRCPNSQQGFSPFTTWTRGLAWIVCGYAEELEYLDTVTDGELELFGGRGEVEAVMLEAAIATADFHIEQSPTDGIPYWDTGAPSLHRLGDYLDRAADPFNEFEPVDSSAAAITCQGLMRLGHYLTKRGNAAGEKYMQAGLTILQHLLEDPYLSKNTKHDGLLLHAVYHQPNGWDYIPKGFKVPNGESCMWGDYHLREAALYAQRLDRDVPYYTFFGPDKR